MNMWPASSTRCVHVAEVMLENSEHVEYGNAFNERSEVHLLFRNDDDRRVEVHMHVNRLVGLQGVL